VPGGVEKSPRPFAYENHLEALYIVQVYKYMRLLGYPREHITILTTYNAQKALLRKMFQPLMREKFHVQNHVNENHNTPMIMKTYGVPLKITTVDQYQGQQNNIVLLSLVRTQHIGHFRDVRRAIVAVSRARLGLYVFGQAKLFRQSVDLKPVMTPLFARPTLLALTPMERYGSSHARKEGQMIPAEMIQHAHHMSDVVVHLTKQIQLS
jgi:intron-binding protein aquarius